MLSYIDEKSYLAKVRMSSFAGRRTLFVEGPSDKKIISAMLVRVLGVGNHVGLIIDSPDAIKNWPSGVLGNRERVEYIHAIVQPQVSDDFFSLVDREWREFFPAPGPEIIDSIGAENYPSTNMLWTRGHSIENYFFSPKFALEYIKRSAPELMSEALINFLNLEYPNYLIELAALSYAIGKNELISRSSGIVLLDSWHNQDGRPRLDMTAVVASLTNRGVSTDKIAKVIHDYNDLRLRMTENLAQWLCHGHIGHTGLASALADVLIRANVPRGQAEVVSNQHDEQMRCYADIIANTVTGDKSEFLDKLVQWIKKLSTPHVKFSTPSP